MMHGTNNVTKGHVSFDKPLTEPKIIKNAFRKCVQALHQGEMRLSTLFFIPIIIIIYYY